MAEKKKPMGNHGKKYANSAAKVEAGKLYPVKDGFDLLLEVAYAKFDESVDVAFNLGVDPKHSDQMVRGALVLPHGIGKTVRVCVMAKGEKAKEAEAAGADFVGTDDLIEKIQGGWLEFDKLVATPDMMVALSKVAKILGPRGLMPNPKTGTVTEDTAKAVREVKAGRVEYKIDKAANVHVAVGKASFTPQQIIENARAVIEAVQKARPASAKGVFVRSITLSLTMSPGVPLDIREFINA